MLEPNHEVALVSEIGPARVLDLHCALKSHTFDFSFKTSHNKNGPVQALEPSF